MKIVLISLFVLVSIMSRAGEPYKFVVNNGKQEWAATAFYISQTQLLTAAHTCAHGQNTFIVRDGKITRVRIAKVDYKADIALLDCDVACADPYVLTRHGTIKIDGFPGGKPLTTTGVVKQIEVTAALPAGMSGSPLVDEGGNVIGMGVMRDGKKHPCYAVPSDALLKFIEAK